jgi:hypothetical protein
MKRSAERSRKKATCQASKPIPPRTSVAQIKEAASQTTASEAGYWTVYNEEDMIDYEHD